MLRRSPLKSMSSKRRERMEGPTERTSRTERPMAREAAAKTCAHCGKPFIPARPMQKVCATVRCAKGYLASQKKAERADFKRRKEAIKTRRDRIAEAQAAVNRYCRLRDIHAGKGCISCGARPEQRFGGAMDAGHFRSVGSAPHMRFFTSQIRLQCVKCNRYLSGNAIEFRRALVAERGAAWVEWIESLQGVAKWSEEYLVRLRKIAMKKTRRLEKRHAM